jgi:thiamine monophosphate kinase
LLFTADPTNEVTLMNLAASCQLRLSRIGEIISADQPPSVLLRRDGSVKPLPIRGFDHFAAQ